jgi:hypothetical protein
LLALATINASHTFGEITEAFSITSGTASTSETIVTQSKGNEIKAVVTTDSYTNTNYLLFKDNVIKKVSVYDIKNQTAVSTDLTSTASTLNVVTGAATKQGEISNADVLTLFAQASGFKQIINFIQTAISEGSGTLTATKNGSAVAIKWIYTEKGEAYYSSTVKLTIDATTSIMSKATIDLDTYASASWDTTTNSPKSGAKALTSNKATIEVTKETVASITMDLTPYFITSMTACSFSPTSTVTTLGVGDVITSITPTKYLPTTAINLSDFVVTASSNTDVIAKKETSGFYMAKAEGESTLTISSIDGSVTYSMKVTVQASSSLSLSGSYSGTLSDSTNSYITNIAFANGMVINGNINCGATGFNMDLSQIELAKSGDSWVLANENTTIDNYKITAFDVAKNEDGSLTLSIKFTNQSDQMSYELSGILSSGEGTGFAYAGTYSGTVTGDGTSVILALTINSDKSFTLTQEDVTGVAFNVAGTIAVSEIGLTIAITSNSEEATYKVTAMTLASNGESLDLTITATKGTSTTPIDFTGSFALASSGASIDDFVGTYSATVSDGAYKLTLEIGEKGVATLKVTKVSDSSEVGTLNLTFTITNGQGSLAITDADSKSSLEIGEFNKGTIGLSGNIVIGTTTITLSDVSFTLGGGESSSTGAAYNATITKEDGNYDVSINLNNGTLIANIACPNGTFNVSYTYSISGTTLTLTDGEVHSNEGGSLVSCTISTDAEQSELTFAISFKLTENGTTIALSGTANKA